MYRLSENRPIYTQLKEYLEAEILCGRFSAGEQIPSTNEIASFFAVNPVTVLKSVGLLADERIVYKKRGVGMFVCPDARQRLQERCRESFAAENVLPMVGKARSLGFTREDLQKIIDEAWNDEAENDKAENDEAWSSEA